MSTPSSPRRPIVKVIDCSLFIVSSLMMLTGAYATGQDLDSSRKGGIIKVTGELEGEQFGSLGLTVKAMMGNMLSVELPASQAGNLTQVSGVLSVAFDMSRPTSAKSDLAAIVRQYAGAGAIIGILDNETALSSSDLAALQKVDRKSNVGFISYVSDDPSSTVIMRNLGTGESDLVQALAYMREYARTVNRPLVVDMRLQSAAMANPLFVQTCQSLASAGIHFMAHGRDTGMQLQLDARQFSIALFDPVNGILTDRMPFWAADEVPGKDMMLAGADGQACNFRFGSGSSAGSIAINNLSSDIVLLQILDTDGTVHSYHLRQNTAVLTPKLLHNGVVMMDDGHGGVLPFQSKANALQGNKDRPVMQTLLSQDGEMSFALGGGSGLQMRADQGRKLMLQLSGLQSGSGLELTDRNGKVVYRNALHPQASSVETRIDLAESCDLYFLKVFMPTGVRNFAVVMN
jgi:hypothetical protein